MNALGKAPGNALGKLLSVSALTLLVAVSLPAPVSAGIKCWTNDEGVRECGNAVPPKYSQKAHRELNETGITVSTTNRAKTKKELREEREEAARQAAIRAEEERKIREQKMKDRVLLSTFTNEADLLRSHEGQVAAIDLRIEHTEKIVVQLERSLAELRQQAAKLELSGKPMTPELETKISRVEKQLQESTSFIEKRQVQKAELSAQFEEDLDRYRELKGISEKSD